jgi:hypothetical protein
MTISAPVKCEKRLAPSPAGGVAGGRSAGRGLEEEALTATVRAAIRHKHTHYDRLLMRGYSRADARDAIREAVDRVMEDWRCPSRG